MGTGKTGTRMSNTKSGQKGLYISINIVRGLVAGNKSVMQLIVYTNESFQAECHLCIMAPLILDK